MSEQAGEQRSAVLAAYDHVWPAKLERITLGANNTSFRVESGAKSFLLKCYQTYDDRANLAYEHRLLGWLAGQSLSFAVPAPLAARNGETLVQGGNNLYALFDWLPGLPPLPTLAQVEAFGAGVGELHNALAAYPMDVRPGVRGYDALGQVHPRVPDPLAVSAEQAGLADQPEAKELFAWWRDELAALQVFVRETYHTLPHQVIHGDMVFVNSLFQGDTLTAILDFEFALPDARAIDLASGLRSLLRQRDTNVVALAQALLGGYQRQVILVETEVTSLPWLIRLTGSVAALWWLGRNLEAGNPRPTLKRLIQVRELTITLEQYWGKLATALQTPG